MHSIGVANVALNLFQKLNIEQSSLIKKTIENISLFSESIFLAGILHDIGKIDSNFQQFINSKKVTDFECEPSDGVHFLEDKKDNKFSFLKYPRHNEISWAISTQLFPNNKILQYAIYYHHAKVIRQNNNKKLPEWTPSQILDLSFTQANLRSNTELFFNEILKHINCLNNMELTIRALHNTSSNLTINCADHVVPKFLFSNVQYENYTPEKREEKDLIEIKNLLIRSLIVSADRIISTLSSEELEDCVVDNNWEYLSNKYFNEDNNLLNSISNMLDNFHVKNESNPINRQRDEQQKDVAKRLSDKKDIATLFGPAGCGKTKIFLELYKNKQTKSNLGNKKLFIITPRKMICSSLFNELRKEYIPNAKIELITGEEKLFWDGNCIINSENSVNVNSEVTITTIDQLISVMLSHKKIDLLLEFLDSYVVFDEFHEFFNISGVVILFKIFLRLKSMLEESNTLLVSATPNYYFLKNILNINPEKSVEYIDTFNKEKYNFLFSTYNIETADKNQLEKSILFDVQKPGTIVIFNTAKQSQTSSIKVNGENLINFHSKFTPEDKNEIYKKILKNWKNKDPACDKVLRSGPIVQASLNISTMNLVTQVCSAENWLQRLGRANRFASKTGIANVTTVLSDKTANGQITNNSEMKFLEKIAASRQTFSWIQFLLNHKTNEENSFETTLTDIYVKYKEFHSLQNVQKSYSEDFEKTIEDSFIIFTNDYTPIEYWKSLKSNKKNKLSSKSIRGNSIYVLPVKYDIYQQQLGDWLYLPNENIESKKLMTLSEKDLIGKEHLFNYQIDILRNIKINGFNHATYESTNKYKSMTPYKIKIEAKNGSSPLLLSYTQNIAKHKEYNQGGIFYVTKGNVKIGLYEMSI